MKSDQEEKNIAYQHEERKNKRKALFTRFIEIINYIILPIQYLTKDVFLLFSSYQSALDVAVPALRFMSKNLSWLYGISFILEGMCALIEATRSENEDKRAFLISQAIFLITGGVILAVFAFTNPQIFVPALCIVWGASTILFLYDVARDMIVNNRQIKHQLKTLHAFRSLLAEALDPDAKIYPADKDRILNLVVVSFDKSIKLLNINDVDTQELRAEIMEKIAKRQDEQAYVTPNDIDQIIQEIMDGEKYNSKINNNILISAAYITISFVCALATFAFFGRSDVTQSVIFSHLLITAGMIGKRLYDFVTNPIIKKAQYANISSKDIDQLSDNELKTKYLKKKLKRLDKQTRRLLDPDNLDRHKLQNILNDYAKVVKEINEKDSPYTELISDLANSLVRDSEDTDPELRQLALALQHSISTRLLYLESNHSCMLCTAMQKLTETNTADELSGDYDIDPGPDNEQSQPTEKQRRTLFSNETAIELNQQKRHNYRVKDINKQCGLLLKQNNASIPRQVSYDSLTAADKSFNLGEAFEADDHIMNTTDKPIEPLQIHRDKRKEK